MVSSLEAHSVNFSDQCHSLIQDEPAADLLARSLIISTFNSSSAKQIWRTTAKEAQI